MEQHLLSPGPLLDENGNLFEAGYAYSLVKKYNREDICVSKWRIKEWDYYYIGNSERAVALTIADNGYMDLASVSVFNFVDKTMHEESAMDAFSFGKLNLPRTSSEGLTQYVNKKKGIEMRFSHENGKRHIYCRWHRFRDNLDLRVDLYLEESSPNTMVIATPWNKKGHFYYNQKINNLIANGYAKIGDEYIDLSKDTLGVLDWGRGVWTYKNTWYWSSLNATQNGHKIGWNLGYGFGNNTKATENMLFIDDRVYKLDVVRFEIPMDKNGNDLYEDKWRITSPTGEVDLIFTPKIVRHGGANALIINSRQRQVFGTFTGVFRLENGETIEVNDLTGFAEKVYNRW